MFGIGPIFSKNALTGKCKMAAMYSKEAQIIIMQIIITLSVPEDIMDRFPTEIDMCLACNRSLVQEVSL